MSKTSLNWLAGACVCALLGACSSPPSTTNEGPDKGSYEPNTEAQDQRLAFASSYENAMARVYDSEFPILGTPAIFFAVRGPASSEIQFVKAIVKMPDGTPFQEMWGAFSLAPNAPKRIDHPEANTTIQVIPAIADGDDARYVLALPVAGTQITRFRLTGSFQVEVSLGSETLTSTFEIVQLSEQNMGGPL